VANVDANDEKNSALSKKYEIQGFPTLKFFPKGQSEPVEYQDGRTEEDLVKFLNEKCGAQRKVGGGLNEKVSSAFYNTITLFAGCVASYGLLFSDQVENSMCLLDLHRMGACKAYGQPPYVCVRT